jgi:hypothetical protein
LVGDHGYGENVARSRSRDVKQSKALGLVSCGLYFIVVDEIPRRRSCERDREELSFGIDVA